MKWLLRLMCGRRESPEEARKRRLCRAKLGLPPEVEYVHVWPGLITLGALSAVLIGLVAWRLDVLTIVAWGLGAIVALGGLAAGCLGIQRQYRHVAAGVLVLVALLGLLAATAHRRGPLAPVDPFGGLDRSALNDSGNRR